VTLAPADDFRNGTEGRSQRCRSACTSCRWERISAGSIETVGWLAKQAPGMNESTPSSLYWVGYRPASSGADREASEKQTP
jgi:hypothetical protein